MNGDGGPAGPERATLPEEELLLSERRRESVEDWWSRHHRADDPVWLASTPPAEVWERLAVLPYLRRGACVLNIGVGRGFEARDLAERGCVVHALDLSPVALERVSDVATGWPANDLEALPAGRFDLACSHLVAQHMTDADLAAQIAAAVRSLKPTGVFALQFASPGPGQPSGAVSAEYVKGGGVLRPLSKVRDMARRAGGSIHRLWDREAFPDAAWTVVHIVRDSPPAGSTDGP